jgi:rhamnosyltransferase
MTVQDAWTTDSLLLQRMLGHFEDPVLMGVCGQQIVPHIKGTNPHQWFRPQSAPSLEKVHFKNPNEFKALSPKEQRALCGWDNVIAMYRKTAMLQLPFEPLIFGEDMLWAKMALEKGWKIIYDSSFHVNHYHHSYLDYSYKRTLISKLFILKCFDYFDNRNNGFKQFLLVIFRNIKLRCDIKWIFYNWKIMYQYNLATSFLLKCHTKNTIEKLEMEFKLNVPIGKTNS